MDSTNHPPVGLWKPNQLRKLFYGPNIVNRKLLSLLPQPKSKALIISGASLAFKTPLVKTVETVLTEAHHAGTFTEIKEHAPIAQLEQALMVVRANPSIDTIISLGGGSPIDSAKWISWKFQQEASNRSHILSNEGFLTHITIPTTLSAAECTTGAAFTDASGLKASVGGHPLLAPAAILYDSEFARYTPKKLWLASGIRALDHAVELMYHPSTTEVPAKAMCMYAAGELFKYLPQAEKSHPDDTETVLRLFLAAFASFEFLGGNMTSGLGLSHALGYALGAPYGIPHGETSCLTLGHVVKLKAMRSSQDAEQIARLLPYITSKATTKSERERDLELGAENVQDAKLVGDRILALVDDLGLKASLTSYGVNRGEIETIVQRATSSKVGGSVASVSPEVYKAVSELVTALFDD